MHAGLTGLELGEKTLGNGFDPVSASDWEHFVTT